MTTKILLYVLVLFLGVGSKTSHAAVATGLIAPKISTAEVTAQTIDGAVSCLSYRVIGICVWLTFDPPAEFGISTTTRVGHYIPDVVVSSYLNTGHNPWTDVQPIVGAVSSAASGFFGGLIGGFALGGGNSVGAESPKRDTGRVKFKNVDIIGNPLAGNYTASSLTCGSVATALQPYYVSDADILAWRFGIPEMAYPQSFTPLLRNISKGLAQWGSVYPRSGSLVSNHDYKAGAVMAQRAGDFVTRQAEPHIYTSLYRDVGRIGNSYTWAPPPLVEGDATTGWWQMLLPNAETTCYVFADVDDSMMGLVDPNVLRINPFEDYVWNLWRPYSCCQEPGDAIDLLLYTGTFP